MFYGRTQYDPVYIVAQIASIQAIFYITLGALLWGLVGEGGTLLDVLLLQLDTTDLTSFWHTLQDHMLADSPFLTFSAALG